ncbi:MAG: hypothetical protein IJQ73_10905, partial [Kiritimatiellae bacterium]|nr:hypothetical protein [Kiritimatiellia bacterium]
AADGHRRRAFFLGTRPKERVRIYQIRKKQGPRFVAAAIRWSDGQLPGCLVGDVEFEEDGSVWKFLRPVDADVGPGRPGRINAVHLHQ